MDAKQKSGTTLIVKVVGQSGAELAPTTPKRARHMLETNVAIKARDESGNFYLQMLRPVRAEKRTEKTELTDGIRYQVLPEAT